MLRVAPPAGQMLPMAPQAPQAGPPPSPPGASSPTEQDTPTRKPKYSAEKVPQTIARYLPPDCRCNNCDFWNGDGTCHIVDGKIDPQGVCVNHTCATDGADKDDQNDGSDGSGEQASGSGPDTDEGSGA